jgi:hypothetical protein
VGQLSRETAAARFSTWNQSSTSIDIAPSAACLVIFRVASMG